MALEGSRIVWGLMGNAISTRNRLSDKLIFKSHKIYQIYETFIFNFQHVFYTPDSISQ